MPGISFKVSGILFSENEREDLLLWPAGETYTLRLGFVLRGTAEVIFPESLLDDWGHEIIGTELYRWMKENGSQFPRAELFGFDVRGRPQQCFIRELDLAVRYACFLFGVKNEMLKAGVRLTGIMLPDGVSTRKRYHQPPAKIPFPLRAAEVEWWAVDPGQLRSSNANSSSPTEGDEQA